MTIRLLPADVSSMIAAGEVVERPASVVKELIENSLDAGASDLSVEIARGGIEYIRVSDDGSGIPSNEIDLAVGRFATSKLANAEELGAVRTLGFRGEALHSIAAVSAVTIATRTPDEASGSRLEVVDGEAVHRGRDARAAGTSVTVRHLFRSFPARRKFLRSVATEASRVQTLVTRYALAYPEVRFRLVADGSQGFASAGSGDLKEAVLAVYGAEVAGAMVELSADARQDAGPIVTGMVSPPSLTRSNRRHVSLFVNRRWIQSRPLGYALEQAYHGFLMERRYPLAVVNVAVAHDEVDVNVHPTKAEVRFRNEHRAFAAVQRAVREALTDLSPVPEIAPAGGARHAVTQAPQPPAFWPAAPFRTQHAQTPQLPESPGLPRKALPVLRVLGQMQNTYVVAEGPDGIYLIDQHAAHERVVFERVRADAVSRTPRVQTLLEPSTLELEPRHLELVETQADAISGTGFLVEQFGGLSVLVRGVPAGLESGDPAAALVDILDLMAEGGGFETWEERAAYSVACHTSIRAGKTLTFDEMSELARQLEDCAQPNTCPHGRPTMVHLSSGQLEREFGRS
jgi:DNA mismatch repair protein MutL